MKHLGFASVSAVNQYLRYAQSKKVELSALIDNAGLSPKLLNQDDGRIKGEQFQALLQALIHESGDPLMGLNSSLYVGPQSYSTLGMIILNCATLGEAIERIPTFERLVGDMGTTDITQGRNALTLRWHCNYPAPEVRPHMVDNVLASWTLFARWLAQTQAHAKEVSLSRAEPETNEIRKVYQNFFGCEVVFGAQSNSITLSQSLLSLPIQQQWQNQGSRDLNRLEGQARSQLSSLGLEGESFSERIRRSIRAHLQLGSARKELIAEEFNLSERTIQRRLAREQTSYQALLDEARLNRARELLNSEHFNHEEIAYNLGFADERCFYRAFKRWTGTSPADYVSRLSA